MTDEPTNIHPLAKLAGAREGAAARPSVKIELDERCFLFPDGKVVRHLLVSGDRNSIVMEGVFDFNETRRSPRIVELSLPEASGFARELANAAYYARTSIFLSDGLQATINVAQHGFLVEFSRFDSKVELMVSVPAAWRMVKGILCAIDARAPGLSH